MKEETGKKEIVKAALDGIILQSLDLINSIKDDGIELSQIKIDGGMVKNDWFNQRLSDKKTEISLMYFEKLDNCKCTKLNYYKNFANFFFL